MNYYRRLKDIREDNDLTQKQIADVLNTTQQQVAKWENGKQMMGIDKYITLSRFYNVSIDYLTGLINDPRPLDNTRKDLTAKEAAILSAYKKNKNVQEAVDILLGLK